MRPPPKLSEFTRYPVVAGTALLAVGVTLAWWAKMDISPLFETAMIRRGELWRLVTSILPHGGVLHLLFNVYWLWVFGTLLEDVYGHLRTAALMLLFAVGSGAWEFAVLSGGIGLSGVGYGLFGLLWMLSRHDERFHDAVDGRTVQLFVGWFFICIVTTLTNIMPIANFAHGVGALTGVLVGLAITLPEHRGLTLAGVAAILLVGLWGATIGRPRINLSGTAGYEEAKWADEALAAHRYPEAARWLRDLCNYQPKLGACWYQLGVACSGQGDKPAALAAYRKAAELGDATAQAYLASVYENGGDGVPQDHAQASFWYGKLAQQNNPEALNNVAWAYATSTDPAIRNPKSALEYARRAVDLGKDHPNPNHLDTLAEALYVNQQFEEAVKTEQQAMALAPPENKADFQKRLEKYQLALKDKNRPAAK